MSSCKYCSNVASHLPAHPDTGELVHICEWHYAQLKPSLAKDVSKYKPCVLCGTMAKRVIAHHVNYFPEQLIQVCTSCHKRIHKGDLFYLCPPDWEKDLFYKKGGLV